MLDMSPSIADGRFSDFLVNEVGLDGEILHLKDISKPKEPKLEVPPAPAAEAPKPDEAASKTEVPDATTGEKGAEAPAESEKPVEIDIKTLPEKLQFEDNPQWPSSHTTTLHALGLLSDDAIVALRNLLFEGSTPPRVSDSGWGSRAPRKEGVEMTEEEQEMSSMDAVVPDGSSGRGGRGRGQGRDRGRGRGARGGRGGRGGGRFGGEDRPVDHREVLSEVCLACSPCFSD